MTFPAGAIYAPPPLVGAHGPPAGANGPPPLKIIFFIWRLFCYFFHIGGFFLYLRGISVTLFSLWEPFLSLYRASLLFFLHRRAFLLRFSLYNDYIANFFNTWGPFCYVFLCIMIILGTFFTMWGPFAPFFSIWGPLSSLYSASATFPPCEGLFAAFFSILGTFFTMLFFFPFGGPFLGPLLLQKLLRTYCHPTPYNYASNNGITI